MKVHEIIEASIEWVAYDGVLGKSPLPLGLIVIRTPDTVSGLFILLFRRGGGSTPPTFVDRKDGKHQDATMLVRE